VVIIHNNSFNVVGIVTTKDQIECLITYFFLTFMNHSWKVGFNFGITLAVITTLGLMMGLESATKSELAVVGGILTIADACSDALGIHISEEGENKHTKKEVWQSTFSTFFFKFIFASIFIIPFLLLEMNAAIITNIVIGGVLLSIFSYKLSRKEKPIKVMFKHLILAAVIIISYFVGKLVGIYF